MASSRSSSACLQTEELLDPLLQLRSPGPERSNRVWSLSTIGLWPSEQVFLHTLQVFALSAAGLSLHNVPWIFPGVVHPSAALVLRASSCAAMMRPLCRLPVQERTHPHHAGVCPLLMLPAVLPHSISAKKTRYRIRKVTKITLTGCSD